MFKYKVTVLSSPKYVVLINGTLTMSVTSSSLVTL